MPLKKEKNKMRNKKGVVVVAAVVFQAAFGIAALSAIAHVPAWTKAKANHTEAAYQAQQMWPQQFFAKLPGGASYNK